MARKKAPSKAVTFRLPLTHYEVLMAVAEARGVDLTAVLNQLVADDLPTLRSWLKDMKSNPSGETTLEMVRSLFKPKELELLEHFATLLSRIPYSTRHALFSKEVMAAERDAEKAYPGVMEGLARRHLGLAVKIADEMEAAELRANGGKP